MTVGREAVTWGNGLVFQPMDLFNPFAPTTVDRDYKVGDDLILVDKLFSNGMDAQLLAVGRRTMTKSSPARPEPGAAAAGFAGNAGGRLLAGRHYADEVYGWRPRSAGWGAGPQRSGRDQLSVGDWEFSAW